MGGERHLGKRGRGAAGKTPFDVAVQTDPENPAAVLHLRMKVLSRVATKDLKPWFGRGFAKGSTIRQGKPLTPKGPLRPISRLPMPN